MRFIQRFTIEIMESKNDIHKKIKRLKCQKKALKRIPLSKKQKRDLKVIYDYQITHYKRLNNKQ